MNEHDERDHQQHNRYRGSAGAVVVLDQRPDPLRRHLCLAGHGAADQHHRPVLADRAGKRQSRTGKQRRQQRGKDDEGEDRAVVRAQRRRGLLDLAVQFQQHRLHRAHDERQRDEQQRDAHAPLGVLDVDSDGAVGPVQRQHHQAGHDRRQRERQVDDRVHQPLARELVPRQHPGDQQPEEQVDHRDRKRDRQRHPERLDRRRSTSPRPRTPPSRHPRTATRSRPAAAAR